MPSHETEAVVLRQYPFGEADLVVVFFTREFGKVRAAAAAARRLKSRLGGAVEPLNHVTLRFFQKEGAELGRVTGCETLRSYLGRNGSLERVYAFTYLAELVNEVIEENNPNYPLFRLLVATLEIGTAALPTPSLLRYFELWTLRLIGLLPDYDYCSACGRCVKEDGFFAVPESGLGRCRDCSHERGVRVRPEAARLLGKLSEESPAQFGSRRLADPVGRDLERLTQTLLELHLERRLKSYPFLKKIAGERPE